MAIKSLDCVTVEDITGLGISSDAAKKLHGDLTEILRENANSAADTWKKISKRILNPNLPFAFHQMMYYGCFKDFGSDPPAWIPDQ